MQKAWNVNEMSSSNQVRKVAIFEYGSHNRQAVSLATTIKSVLPEAVITLFYRNDWYKFDNKSFIVKKTSNQYLMLLAQLCYTCVGYRIIVSTSPEACRLHVKLLFKLVALIKPYRFKRIVCLRDIKLGRGESIHRFLTKYTTDSIVVENRSIAHACKEAGLRVNAVHPPNTHRDRPTPRGPVPPAEETKIVLLGSLDTERRNYDIPAAAFEALLKKGHKLQIRIGGQCRISKRSKFLWRRLQLMDSTLQSRVTLLDHELDQVLMDADVTICCNRRDYYGSMKSSGAFGDTILSGRVCLASIELLSSFKNDEGLFDFYLNESDLFDKILAVINSKTSNMLSASLVESYVSDFEELFLPTNSGICL